MSVDAAFTSLPSPPSPTKRHPGLHTTNEEFGRGDVDDENPSRDKDEDKDDSGHGNEEGKWDDEWVNVSQPRTLMSGTRRRTAKGSGAALL